jgi:hypothetical protein
MGISPDIVYDHMLEISWFVHCVNETFAKSFQIFTTAYTCDITTTRQISRFLDFICILYN